jgi:hypothetical protein
MNIEIRDFIAAQLMSGKVNDFYSSSRRENIGEKNGKEEWVQVSAEEATKREIDKAAKNAYVIADAMIRARKLYNL